MISLLDEVTRGGSDPQMHAYVLKSFEAAQVLLNTELRVGLAQQSNWLTTERYAQLKLAPARTSGTKGDPAAAALLTSASTWESFAVSIHRAMHQQPRGAQYWRRVGRSLTECRSVNATAALERFEGADVHSRGALLDLLQHCWVDGKVVEAAVGRRKSKAAAEDVDTVGLSNIHGWTALHHSVFLASPSVKQQLVDALLKAGASLTAQTDMGHTPFHIAAFRGSPEVARRLLQELPPTSQPTTLLSDLLGSRDQLGRTASDLCCLHRPELSESMQAEAAAADGWMGETYAVLRQAGSEACPQAVTKKKTQKSRKMKKKKKNRTSSSWSETQWGDMLQLPEGYKFGDEVCDIAIAEGDLSSDGFYTNYISLNKPVLIRQAKLFHSPFGGKTGEISADAAARPWSVEGLERLFGQRQMQSFNVPRTLFEVAGFSEHENKRGIPGGVSEWTTLSQFVAELKANITANESTVNAMEETVEGWNRSHHAM